MRECNPNNNTRSLTCSISLRDVRMQKPTSASKSIPTIRKENVVDVLSWVMIIIIDQAFNLHDILVRSSQVSSSVILCFLVKD
ncbi:hypothetical protein PILCRDRAFT_823738 [Piloderma croceum F 1598]|uniref:Uncharacterized protein n=1 Tax=Piloderma croceum (strain F 1598) TaxID=765440 RepID=A0A0C3FH97_PILCF|nr:hypothetical protein PILCRDRAFT_823738 [Piloderma croceum F 1598]